MVGEDYRSRANHNYLVIRDLEEKIRQHLEKIGELEGIIRKRDEEIKKGI